MSSVHGRTPYFEGEEFGRELVAVSQGDITPRQVYNLGKRFANLFNWRDLDSGGDFVQGFMAGIEYQRSTKQIAPPPTSSAPQTQKRGPNSVADALRQKADELDKQDQYEEEGDV